MPKAFDAWQVHQHGPLEKFEPNLWRVQASLPGRAKGRRVMTIARTREGELLIHNGVALEDPLMAEIEAFGKPSWLVVPNGIHRLDSKIYKQRYPQLRVLAPAAARKKVEQVVPVDAGYAEPHGDETVRMVYLDGLRENEGVLEVRSDGKLSLVFNDAIFNQPKFGGILGFVLGPTGRPAVPRFVRWTMVKDKRAFRAHLERMAAMPELCRIIVSHGKMIDERPGDVLRAVAAEL